MGFTRKLSNRRGDKMTTAVVLFILFTHWFADFFCQTDWQARNKSNSNEALTQHILVYTSVWIIPSLILLPYVWAPAFLVITFLAHWLTDYCTSRLNTKLWKAGQVHWFFVSVGFDQILHYVQLFWTYKLLK